MIIAEIVVANFVVKTLEQHCTTKASQDDKHQKGMRDQRQKHK